jgi:hypothetical protein
MKTSKSIAAIALGLAFATTGAFAQGGGLISVDVSNVANNLAKNLSVDVSQIPVTVQAPIGVAATVCGVAANVLGTQAPSGNGSCTATSTSTALDNLVQSQLKKSNKS